MARFNSERLALEVKRARKPFALVAGLFVVALFCAFLMFRNIEVRWPWSAANEVKVEFTDVKGVRPGQQQVRLAGVPVGLISDAKIKGDKAILTLSIDDKHGKIYKNARIRLRPVTPLQDMYVAIESRGTPDAGVVRGDTVLPAKRTEAPVDVANVLNTFEPDTRKQMEKALDGLSKGLDDGGLALRETFVAMAPFLQQAQRLTSAVAERRTNMTRLVRNSGELLDALNKHSRELTQLMEVGHSTLDELARRDVPLASTLAQLPGTLSTMRSSFAALRDAQQELDPALAALLPVAERLPSTLDAARELSGDAMPALRRLQPAVKQLRPLAKELVPTSNALAGAVDSLRTQVPRLDRATKKIKPCEAQIAGFFNNHLSVFKYGDDYGAIPRGEFTAGLTSVGGQLKDPMLRRGPTCTQKEGR
ncbi:MlaD family protein [Patulibacter sp. NPDC049589]|uniref:MlaD family protein n=1 Tax=Patulibacter sp. NPDC049589 TaxID=3154731 RepID=UPI00341F865A